ncbi:MAG TPA: sigma-70 family RNA polymerase sigma factor, partial [Rugosimonospora sp.]|nr:sigma-70 family RNA polymerase sigma factor [Rugosimonospora sp.]
AALTAEVFEELYRAHRERLYQHALGMLNANPWDSEDAVSEAFARALEQRDRYEDRGRPALAWLITLVKFVCLTYIRDRRPVVESAPDVEDVDKTTPYPGLEDPATHAALAEVWPRLSQRQAVAVWCRHVGGYTVEETAKVLGVAPKTAQNMADEGLRRIAAYFRRGPAPHDCRRCGWPHRSVGHRSTCGKVP